MSKEINKKITLQENKELNDKIKYINNIIIKLENKINIKSNKKPSLTLELQILELKARLKKEQKNKQALEQLLINKDEYIKQTQENIKLQTQNKLKEPTERILNFINQNFNITSNEKDRIKASILLNLYNSTNEIKIDYKQLKKCMVNNNLGFKRFNNGSYYINLELKPTTII